MSMTKKEKAYRAFRNVPDFRESIRRSTPNEVMDLFAAIIDALPDGGAVPVEREDDDSVTYRLMKDAQKLRVMEEMEEKLASCPEAVFRKERNEWQYKPDPCYEGWFLLFVDRPEPAGTDQPKQTPPPIGPEEARGYMDRSAIDARLCLTQNTQMISLLREIRDALVQRLEVRE